MEDTLCTCAEYLTIARREKLAEHRAQTYHSLVLQGKLRMAVQWITERETSSVLQPSERCKEMGERVIKVRRTKHLEAFVPTAASLDSYPDRPLEMVPLNITDNTMTAVTGRLSGEAGPGGKDSVSLQH